MTEEETPKVETPEVDVDALLETMEKAGINDVKGLEGKIEASRQAGNLANQLGDTRAQLEQVNRELAETKAMFQNQSTPQANTNDFDMDNYSEGQTINLQEEVAKGVKKVMQEMQSTQIQAQRQAAQVANAIQRDRFYPAVKEIWEARCADPNFIMEVQSGRTNPINAYKDLVIEFQGKLLNQSTQAIKQTRGVQPPNVESGDTRGQAQGNLVSEGPSQDSPNIQQQKELLDKVAKGYRATDDEIIDKFDDVFNEAFKG